MTKSLFSGNSKLWQDYGYERHGMPSLFLWYEPLARRRGVSISDRHAAGNFAKALRHLADEVYP